MRFNRRYLPAALLFCAAALLAGCVPRARSVVGVWDIRGGPTSATMTFQADGNFKTEASRPGQQSTVFGQYTREGDRVTFNMPHRTATIRWKSDDEIVMTGDDGVAMTLTRRK